MPQKFRCVVTEIQDHGGQVYSVFLEPETAAPRFRPGQFLHLALDEYTPGDFWPDSRSFSIASSPVEQQSLRITYAVKGQFTTRMEKELYVGRQVWVKMPYGEFVVRNGRDVCLLAGGTGITAFTAFLAGLPENHACQVQLFYGAQRPHLLIYRSLVEAAALRCPALKIHFLAERDSDGTGCLPGRIEPEIVLGSVPNPLSLLYYLAGPPAMVHALTDGLHQRGLAPEQILADAWQ